MISMRPAGRAAGPVRCSGHQGCPVAAAQVPSPLGRSWAVRATATSSAHPAPAAPRVELPAADGMLAGDLRWRQSRPQTLGDDLALLVQRPCPASIVVRDNLDAWAAYALTTYLMSGLSVRTGRNRGLVHNRLPSQHGPVPPCVAATSLTSGFGRGRYGLAGFRTNQAFRKAKSGLRQVGRALDPDRPDDGAETPARHALCIVVGQRHQVECLSRPAVRCPAVSAGASPQHRGPFRPARARCLPALPPCRGESGRRAEAHVQLWQHTAAQHPDWPQTR